MSQYILTEKSLQDLKGIARYTTQTWGSKQRQKYLAELAATFKKIARNPRIGRFCPDLSGQPFKYSVGRHLIFYRPKSEGVEIIRILHDSMDFERHL
jgi:toxin ParE1/3/4